ncbi:LysE family transporter [Paenibacillus sp. BK720]|uniref:LysE family transporter n=1 Tax=Paenibacillus sp. BK720 TaxID=2587092 RepID=UPI001420729A|nr:LysE family transporter [Paenibacillus sp. BK720]NIK71705.1 threonine/homoserine/homoserine lactone efflux protein [Paenibacillus sp. BK720]
MTFFLEYILLGLSLAAPIGPINAAQMARGIRGGFWNAWLLGLGSMTADILYLLVVYLGTVHFLQTPFLKTLLWSFGCFVLLYTGFESLYNTNKTAAMHRNSLKEPVLKSFGTGFFLSLLNPLSIMFWIGIYGSVLAEAAQKFEPTQLIIYTSGILLGIFLWDLSMAVASSHFHRVLNNRALGFISVLSGLSLIGFGLYFGIEALKQLFL